MASNKKKATKVALLTSLLSMVMCVAMLVGSTFAWFTDTAETKVNNIIAGTLEISLEKKDKYADTWTALGEDESLQWVSADTTKTEILWEPGCTYNLQSFRVVNNGNLAVKYQIVVNGLTGTNSSEVNLLDKISFTVKVGTEAEINLAEWSGHIDPAASDTDPTEGDEIVLCAKMDQNAGNDYKNLTAEGISISIVATQYTQEQDITGPDYDEGAQYPAPVIPTPETPAP